MNVYRVLPSIEDPRTKKEVFSAVNVKSKKDAAWLNLAIPDEFDGKPFPRKWRPIALKLVEPTHKRPDFYHLEPRILVCSEWALNVVRDCLLQSGELLPIQIEGERGEQQIHNITKCLDVLDKKASVWKVMTPDWKRLVRPAFRPKRLGSASLFKISEDYGLRIYCVERTGKPGDGEFKALVEQHKLRGLEFQLVWTSGSGAVMAGTATSAASKRSGSRQPQPQRARKHDNVTQQRQRRNRDRALTKKEAEDIRLSVARGHRQLRLAAGKASSQQTQKHIRDAIDKVVLGKSKLTGSAKKDLAVNLGCLWGQTICDAVGWEWCFARINGTGTYCVVPPNRSYAIAPMQFVLEQLNKKPPADNTSLLLFNMVKAGTLPKSKARAYPGWMTL
jgi:hypothetical protein